MHPTNIRQKYENLVRDHLVRMGSDLADEIEYEVMLNSSMNVTIVLRIAAYDGHLLIASRAMFPAGEDKHVAVTTSNIGDTVCACLMELKRLIEEYDRRSGWWEERLTAERGSIEDGIISKTDSSLSAELVPMSGQPETD